jgi:hypothetical protein
MERKIKLLELEGVGMARLYVPKKGRPDRVVFKNAPDFVFLCVLNSGGV